MGTGIAFITHTLGFARQLADNFVFLDQGKIVESGNADMLSTPKSERMKEFIALA